MDMQNVSNLTIPEGQVRTIHDKDSRLIWGRVAYNTKYAGDTYQQTYSGKNKVDAVNPTDANYATASLSNNVITVSSTATNTLPYVGWVIDNLSANDVVRYSGVIMDSTGQIILQFDDNGRWITINGSVRQYSDGTTAATYPWTNTVNTTKVRLLLYANKSKPTSSSSSRYKNVILTVNNSDLSYEPYVGGTPAPNPSYPQPISTVTGEQTVEVTGKNLLNASADTGSLNGVNYTKNGDGTYTVNGTANGTSSFVVGSIELTANTQYVVSGCPGTGSGSSYNVRIRDANYTALGFDVGNGATITPTETKTYYYQITVVSGQSVSNLVFKPMICLSTTSNPDYSSYEPYQSQSYTVDLGSTELCKIGDYQDYIYKSGDDWYVHKACGEALFNGTENWDYFFSTAGVYINRSYIAPIRDSTINCISDHFMGTTRAYIRSNLVTADGVCCAYSTEIVLANKDQATIEGFKTWLSTHNTILYYILATPTDTQITDATLISQLNAVHEWLTRYGYESTVSGDLPIVLQRDSLQ